jgi:hypothetical protein
MASRRDEMDEFNRARDDQLQLGSRLVTSFLTFASLTAQLGLLSDKLQLTPA